MGPSRLGVVLTCPPFKWQFRFGYLGEGFEFRRYDGVGKAEEYY